MNPIPPPQGSPPPQPATAPTAAGPEFTSMPEFTPPPPPPGAYLHPQSAAEPYVHLPARPCANPWLRVVARLIDTAITLAVSFVIVASVSSQPSQERGVPLLLAGSIAALAFNALYNIVPVAICGATPGKAMCRLRVVTNDGHRSAAGWKRAIGRFALPVAIALGGVAGTVGVLVVVVSGVLVTSTVLLFADAEHRTVEDRVAGTVVVTR